MFVSKDLIGLFQIAKETVDSLREELAAARAELAAVKIENASLKTTNEWMRHQINGLEVERAGLIQKVYGIALPVPEIVSAQSAPTSGRPAKVSRTLANVSFDNIDDEIIKKLDLEDLVS